MKEMGGKKRKIQSETSIQRCKAQVIIYLALKKRIFIEHNDLAIKRSLV